MNIQKLFKIKYIQT